MNFFYKLFGWKEWTVIEDCPLGTFKARIEYDDGEIVFEDVYVHTDGGFPFWRCIRLKNRSPKTKFKVTHWKK